jgi:hypothetical protein
MVEEVSILFMPSQSQKGLWWHLVMPDDGVDQDGYWLGWCPIHDSEKDEDTATAQFNFRKGVMRCLGEPSCHPDKRVMSLMNVALKIGEAASRGQR